MYSQFADNQPIEADQSHLNAQSSFAENDSSVTQVPDSASEVSLFRSHFQGSMEMYAEAEKVTAYLDDHQNWFTCCAHPMKVESLGRNAYALVIGRFGSFGYEVEPKIGLELLPQENQIYRIRTIPIPNYVAPGYEVDFQASQTFVEVPASEYFQEHEHEGDYLPKAVTCVDWELELTVGIRFPRFIQKLPQSLIQSTGDSLMRQVVRQVSRRLTHKVQQHFHTSLGLPIPKKLKKR
jgi:hypothetical protein